MAPTTGLIPQTFSLPIILRHYIILLCSFLILAASPMQADDPRVSKFLDAAAKGNAEAQYRLGIAHQFGQGVEKDLERSRSFYEMAARQGHAFAQNNLGTLYAFGLGVEQDQETAARWYAKAAEQGLTDAMNNLGWMLSHGMGVDADPERGLTLIRAALAKGNVPAENNLGVLYQQGLGVEQNDHTAGYWFRRAARKGNASAQKNLGMQYLNGTGVKKDTIEAAKWLSIALTSGDASAKEPLQELEKTLTPEQIEAAKKRILQFKPEKVAAKKEEDENEPTNKPRSIGTGFFITKDGYILTNHHVIDKAKRIIVRHNGRQYQVKSAKYDALNDVALLKVDGEFPILPIISSRHVSLGDEVFTIGYPNVPVQGSAPKLTSGQINSLRGERDDPRFFQTSTQIQPGNSGGALVNEAGQVVAVVTKRLKDMKTLERTGFLPQDVNYALKASYALAFLELEPEVLSQVLENHVTKASSTAEARIQAEAAAAMIIAY